MGWRRKVGAALKGLLLGVGLGGACACPDGILLGAIFTEGPEEVATWAIAFALGGAGLGGLIGLLTGVFGRRLVLPPPGEDRKSHS
ncbi:MAG: hypothetical protein IT429_22980 [Gemmataceae bacterium]|nr:hypothetical protein [Gemmataceae bacterium]